MAGFVGIPEPTQVEGVHGSKGIVVTFNRQISKEALGRLRKEWQEAFPDVPLAIFCGASGAIKIT